MRVMNDDRQMGVMMKIQGQRTGNKNKGEQERWKEWINSVGNYAKTVTYAYLIFIIAVFPFYAPKGYVEIGIHKFYFFKMVGLVCFGMLVPAVLLLLFMKWRRKEHFRCSVTDKAMLLYGVAVFLSFVCTEWKEEALWGTEGWYMGAVSQLMFVAIYFVISRFVENEKVWYSLFLMVSSCVFLLGLLNRFSIYPFEMKGANPIFISTLGNINWFCSYWMVLLPIGLVFYWSDIGDTVLIKAGLMLYIIVGFMTGIVQGSSSGFLALGTMIFAIFCLSFRKENRLLRWFELMILFAVSVLVISVLKSLFPESMNYQNTIAEKITEYSFGVLLLSVFVVCYTVLRYWIKHKELKIEKLVILRNIVAGIVLLAAVVVGILVVYYNSMPETIENSRLTDAFIIDSDWGNSRGATWTAGVEAFATMTFREKMVGVGPDCFYRYVYSEWEIATELYNVFGDARLTNAHNEWLTTLVNLGICGVLPYITVFITAVFRQLKEGKKHEPALVSAVCIITYTIHNMVSFQQVICTPVVFILIGMGESVICRKLSKNVEKN
ncbi:MAG: O-antigen ligase family protein [Lachnospiraceae bacterium]|nr:O-antigen ligase family protein [Lachnospiraceae bacterium]